MSNNAEYAMPIPDEVLVMEQTKEFLKGALAPIDVKEGLKSIVDSVQDSAASFARTVEYARKHPKEALAAAIGIAGVIAGMAPSLEKRNISAQALAELNASYDNPISVEAPTGTFDIPYELPDSIPFPNIDVIPRTYPISAADVGTIELNPPISPPEIMIDFLPPLPPSTNAITRETHRPLEKRGLTFSNYQIKPGDTLSDITYREVYKGQVSPYSTNAEGGTDFSQEFCDAAKEIAIENLAIGSMHPPEITTEGDTVGLTATYNANNEQMTVDQQVHEFVVQVNNLIKTNPGDRDALRDLFDNGIAPELLPHVLRYLVAEDTINLPNYDLKQFTETDQQLESNRPQKNPHNSKYFNNFGGRVKKSH